jgi:hypothetical protein
MESVQNFRKSYLQAPWRRQLQITLTILLVIISVAIVAYLYLNIAAQSAAAGRQIQSMQVQMDGHYRLTDQPEGDLPIEELVQSIADLEGQLALLTTYEVMDTRARELNLQPALPEEIIYLEAPGYQGQNPAVMAPPPELVIVSASGFSPDFHESLLDWIEVEILKTAALLKETQP